MLLFFSLRKLEVTVVPLYYTNFIEELDGPAVSALWLAIVEVKQRWSVIGWVTKNLLSRGPPCFERHVKPLVPAAFAVVSTRQPHWARVVGYGPLRKACAPAEGTLIGWWLWWQKANNDYRCCLYWFPFLFKLCVITITVAYIISFYLLKCKSYTVAYTL
jgi:hypothetical protein